MQLSVRSHFFAGTAALMGAAVIMPMAAPSPILADSAAVARPVSLLAFANPITELVSTLEMAQNYVFATYYNGGDAPTAGAGEANWPSAGFDQSGGEFLNYLLYNEVALGYYNAVGVIPQNVTDASPLVRQLEVNWSDYINTALRGVTAAATAIGDGIWNLPAAVVDAVQLVLSGQFTEALSALSAAIVTPIQTAVTSLLTAGSYIGSNFVARLSAVANALPQVVRTIVGATVGGAALEAQKSAEIGTAIISNLLSLDVQGAWNAAVEGFLGPSGLPGTLLNLSIGAGIQTGVIADEGDIATNFVPSTRTALQAAEWTLADALSTSVPSAASIPARSAATVRRAKSAAAKSAQPTRVGRAAAARAAR